MDVTIIGLAIIVYLASLGVVYILITKRSDKKIRQYGTLTEAINTAITEKQQAENALTGVLEKVEQAKEAFKKLDAETKDLQVLRTNAGSIADQLAKDRAALDEVEALIAQHQKSAEEKETAIHEIMSKIDLYSRLDAFVEYGHFEMPEYLYETGERFSAEIKILRNKQKSMIKDGSAFTQEGEVNLTGDSRVDKKIIDGQMKLVLRAFNIECDMLIGKVSPSNFERTLGRIEKLANDLEKLVASLRCGISVNYVTLKYGNYSGHAA